VPLFCLICIIYSELNDISDLAQIGVSFVCTCQKRLCREYRLFSAYIYINIYIYIHAYIFIHIYIHIYIYIHM